MNHEIHKTHENHIIDYYSIFVWFVCFVVELFSQIIFHCSGYIRVVSGF
jgi:hypothetical protein